LIFFLVAALVSLTGMTRMVEEQRGQIGLLEALGYGKGTVLKKFAGYCLLATAVGSAAGVLAGEKFLPYFIISAYGNAYAYMDTVRVPYHIPYALLAAGAAIGCSLLATLFACYALMRSNPAQLMRPAAPKMGNKILLERIGFFWKHLKFSQKATLRNLFRYKKRLLMTVFGIGGCTALILVGFGIKDSVTAIMDRQFDVVWRYDEQLAVDTDASDQAIAELDQYLAAHPQIASVVPAYENTAEFGKNGRYKDGYLIVPANPRRIAACFDLHDRETGTSYKLTDE
jgi:putative ABC transport system permease protein